MEIARFQPVNGKGTCGICREPSTKLVGHPNSSQDNTLVHFFDQECLSLWFATNPDNPVCPWCKKIVDLTSFYPLRKRIGFFIHRNLKTISACIINTVGGALALTSSAVFTRTALRFLEYSKCLELIGPFMVLTGYTTTAIGTILLMKDRSLPFKAVLSMSAIFSAMVLAVESQAISNFSPLTFAGAITGFTTSITPCSLLGALASVPLEKIAPSIAQFVGNVLIRV